MRIDRLLVYLRFARTRARAIEMVSSRALRLNRKRVQRASQPVAIGDVLTLMAGNEVRVIEIVDLPSRRGSAEDARSHYHELDRAG
ncbi:MAG: S4 domain-containing protein [Pseudomonadota bacterium]